MAENEDLGNIALDCYRAAVRDVAFYAIELDKDVTAQYRRELARLETCAGEAPADALPALLRTYRKQTVAYVSRLSRELADSAAGLRQILDFVVEGDGDYETRLRRALARLEAFACSPQAGGLHKALIAAISTVKGGLDEIARRQGSAVAQLMEEIRILHKKIDSMESAASVEVLAAVLARAELEKRIQSQPARAGRLMLLAVAGFREAQAHFDKQVATQLAAGFLKRLYRILPDGSAVGRWSEEEFLILLADEQAAIPPDNILQDQLSGSYACSQDGKTVRPTLQVRISTHVANSLPEAHLPVAFRLQ